MMAALRRWFGRWHGINESEALISSGGTSTAITVTYSNAPASLFTGLEVGFKVTTTCGADPTLNVNSLGAKNIQKLVGGSYSNLIANDIVATQHVKVKYDGTLDKWILLTPHAKEGISFFAHNGSVAQSVTSATDTKVTFGTETWDVGSYFASSAWSPPAGKYRVSCAVTLDGTNAVDNEQITLQIWVGGALWRSSPFKRAGPTGAAGGGLCTLVDLDGSQAVEVYVNKGGAGNGQVAASGTQNWFCGESI